jgi:hypothetical protein
MDSVLRSVGRCKKAARCVWEVNGWRSGSPWRGTSAVGFVETDTENERVASNSN